MFNKKLQRFSIRKLTVGAASVLIGISFISMNNNNTVHAANMPVQTTAQTSQDKLNAANNQLAIDNANLKNETDKTAVLQQNVDAKQKELNNALINAQKAQAQTEQAKKVLDEAKTKAHGKEEAVKDVVDKQIEAGQAKNDLTKAMEQHKQIKSDEIKKNEEISNQNKEISNTQNVLKDAQKTQADAKNKLNDANADAEQKAATLQDAYNTATKAQDALTNSENTATKAKDDKKTADQSLVSDQESLNNAKINAQNKANDVTDAKNKLDTATTNKNQLKEDVNTAQSDLDAANSTLDQAKAAAKPYMDQLKALNDRLNYLKEMTKNTVNLGDSRQYTEILVKYLNKEFSNEKQYTPEELDYLTPAERDFLDNGSKRNKYISSELDKNIKIDNLNNLTDDEITELSLFTQDIINSARKQLNPAVKNDIVTKGSVAFAKQVAQRYIQDLKDGSWTPGWHDAQGINDVAKENNMYYWPIKSNKNQPYEDWTYGRRLDLIKTMDDLKAYLYSSLKAFLLPDRSDNMYIGRNMQVKQEMGHATGVLGVDTKNLKYNINWFKKNLGDVEKASSNTLFEPWDISTETWKQVGESEYVTKDEFAKQLNEQISIWQSKLDSLNNNQLTVDMLPDSYISSIATIGGGTGESRYPSADIHTLNVKPSQLKENSNFDFTEIQSYQDQIKSINNQISNVTSQAQPLLTALQNAQNTANSKQFILNTAKDNLQYAVDAYNQANQKLQEANNALTTANDKVQSLRNLVTNDKDNVNKASANLTAALNDVEDKKNALQDAKNKQALASQDLEKANQRLNEAHNVADSADQNVSNLTALLNNKNLQLEQLKNELNELFAKEAILPHAQQKFNQAQVSLKTAQDKLSQIEAAIRDAQKKQDAYNTAKANSDKLNNLNQAAQAALKKANTALVTNQNNIKDLHNRISEDLALITQLKSEEHVKSTNSEPMTGVAHIKNSDSRLTLVDGEGKPSGQTIPGNSNYKVFAKKNINGKTYYRLGTDKQWVVADAVASIISSVKSNTAREEEPFAAIGHIPVLKKHPTWKIALVDSNGHYTGKYLATNTNWKVLAKKTINGKTYYRLGTEQQWIPAEFLQVKKTGIVRTNPVKHHPTWKIALLNRNGKYSGEYVKPNANWKVWDIQFINGQMMARIGTQAQWIPMEFVSWVK